MELLSSAFSTCFYGLACGRGIKKGILYRYTRNSGGRGEIFRQFLALKNEPTSEEEEEGENTVSVGGGEEGGENWVARKQRPEKCMCSVVVVVGRRRKEDE